eukprot:scaffold5988_cov381-Prasinococcus_capsulatus_cf.AAC.4
MGVARADQLGPARTPKSTSGNKRQAVAAAPGALDEAPGKAEPKKSSKPRRKSDGKSKSKGADAGDLELPPTGSDDFTIEVAHMMFVFGDCRRKMTEEQKPVLLLVSSIVRQYCLELVGEALKLAHLRGSPSISVDDLVWGLRHDRRKILRVAMFLDRRVGRGTAVVVYARSRLTDACLGTTGAGEAGRGGVQRQRRLGGGTG